MDTVKVCVWGMPWVLTLSHFGTSSVTLVRSSAPCGLIVYGGGSVDSLSCARGFPSLHRLSSLFVGTCHWQGKIALPDSISGSLLLLLMLLSLLQDRQWLPYFLTRA